MNKNISTVVIVADETPGPKPEHIICARCATTVRGEYMTMTVVPKGLPFSAGRPADLCVPCAYEAMGMRYEDAQ